MKSVQTEKSYAAPLLNGRERYLVEGYFRKRLNQIEKDELDDWLMKDEENMRFFEHCLEKEESDPALTFLEELITGLENRKSAYGLLAAAIIVFVGVSMGILFLLGGNKGTKRGNELVNGEGDRKSETGAQLKMENGLVIPLLDRVVLLNYPYLWYDSRSGVLWYGSNWENRFHTLQLNAQKTMLVCLNDGTRIWLNASSQIIYPVSTDTQERTVELEGEAYFEVAEQPTRPFRVKVKDLIVEAVGTSFNINSFERAGVETALIDGVVKVNTPLGVQLLSPGRLLTWSGGRLTESGFDQGKILGWKDNFFVFKNTAITTVLAEIQHWYGVAVKMESDPTFSLNATIPRSISLQKLLELLEQTGHARFHLNNDTIWVRNWHSN